MAQGATHENNIPLIVIYTPLSAHPERRCVSTEVEGPLRLVHPFDFAPDGGYAQDERRECGFFHEVTLGGKPKLLLTP